MNTFYGRIYQVYGRHNLHKQEKKTKKKNTLCLFFSILERMRKRKRAILIESLTMAKICIYKIKFEQIFIKQKICESKWTNFV